VLKYDVIAKETCGLSEESTLSCFNAVVDLGLPREMSEHRSSKDLTEEKPSAYPIKHSIGLGNTSQVPDP